MKLNELRKLNAKQRQAARKAKINESMPSAVSGGFRAGKRKRGTSLMRVKPSESRVANLTQDQLDAMPQDRQVFGIVKHDQPIPRMAVYKRGSE